MGENSVELSQENLRKISFEELEVLNKEEIDNLLLSGLCDHINKGEGVIEISFLKALKFNEENISGTLWDMKKFQISDFSITDNELFYYLCGDLFLFQFEFLTMRSFTDEAKKNSLSPYERKFFQSILATGYADSDFDNQRTRRAIANYFLAIRGLELLAA